MVIVLFLHPVYDLNELFSSNRIPMFYAQEEGANIASRYKEMYGVGLFLR